MSIDDVDDILGKINRALEQAKSQDREELGPFPEYTLAEEREATKARIQYAPRRALAAGATAPPGPGRDVPCVDCKRPCPVSPFALAIVEDMSAALRASGQPALTDMEIGLCRDCALTRATQSLQRRQRREAEYARKKRAERTTQEMDAVRRAPSAAGEGEDE